jgi:hypothetical protein
MHKYDSFAPKRAFLGRTGSYCRQLIYFLVNGLKAGIFSAAEAKFSPRSHEGHDHCVERLSNDASTAGDAKDTRERQWREGEAELG